MMSSRSNEVAKIKIHQFEDDKRCQASRIVQIIILLMPTVIDHSLCCNLFQKSRSFSWGESSPREQFYPGAEETLSRAKTAENLLPNLRSKLTRQKKMVLGLLSNSTKTTSSRRNLSPLSKTLSSWQSVKMSYPHIKSMPWNRSFEPDRWNPIFFCCSRP